MRNRRARARVAVADNTAMIWAVAAMALLAGLAGLLG
jgi:hypothetical protein